MRPLSAITLTLAMMLVGAPGFAGESAVASVSERAGISDFVLNDIDGNPVRLSDHQGKVVVVSFWATWCEPCKQELGYLNEFYGELKERGFEVIAVATDAPETQSRVRSVARQKGWDIKVVQDTAGSVSAQLNPRGATPYSIFVDRRGKVAYDHEGYTVGDEVTYRSIIEGLLGEEATSKTSASAGGPLAEGSIGVTDTFILEARGDNGADVVDDNYLLGVNRLNLNGSAGDYSVWARFDAWKFINRPKVQIDGNNPHYKFASLERLNFRYQGEGLELVAGDFYRQLGRGIALSLRKGDEVSVETTLRGAEVGYRVGPVNTVLFGGALNNSNLDPVTRKTLEDLPHQLGGGLLEVALADGVNLLAYGYHMGRKEAVGVEAPEKDRDDWNQVVGGALDLPGLIDSMTLYVEGDYQRRQATGMEEGYAGFVSTNLELGDTNVLLEGLYLNEFKQGFQSRGMVLGGTPVGFVNSPPTLARIRDEVETLTDVYGTRLRLEHYFEEQGLLLFASGRYRVNNPNQPGFIIPTDEVHGYGGMEYTYNGGASHLNVSAGYRQDIKDEEQVNRIIHYYVDYVQSLRGGLSLHLISDTEYREKAEEYLFGSTFIGLDRSGLGGLTFEFGYDTREKTATDYYFAGILKWHLSDEAELRAIGGTQHGGLKCVNGVCREYPEFVGFKSELITRF